MAGNQVTNGPGSHVLATGHTFMARLTPNSANIIIRAMHLVAALFINELDQGVLANPTYYAVPFSLLNNQMTKDHSRSRAYLRYWGSSIDGRQDFKQEKR